MHAGGNKWTDDMTIKFLELYEQRPCLWETDNPNYKCRVVRNEALRTLVEQMGIPGFDVTTCKLKIKNIRSHYCQELKKIYYSSLRREQDPAQRSFYRPSLVWFNTINRFLRNHVHQTVFEPEDSFMEPKTEVQEEFTDVDLAQNILVKQEDEDEESVESTSEVQRQTKRKSINRMSYGKHKKIKKLKMMNPPEGEFEIFCKSIALQLNKMPLENALRLQLNIQNLVTEERLKCLQDRHG